MIARPGAAPTTPAAELLSRGRNRAKARVLATEWAGTPAVRKSVAHQPAWLRWAVGVRALDREERAYRLLAGVAGVPAFLARPDPHSLVCQRISGRRLDDHGRRSLPAEVFAALAEVIRRAHERGVAHGDLHRRDVILDASGGPWVVDWATSLGRDGRGGALRAALFRRWMEVDRRALEKLRRRYSQELGPGADELQPAWWPHRWAWRLKRALGGEPEPPGGRSQVWGRVRLAGIYAAAALLVILARPSPLWMAAGLALVVPGEAVRLWAAGHLLKSKELVTSGPYAYTQNPLYLGRLLILTGLALMSPAPGGLNWMFLVAGMAGFFGYYLPRKLRVEGARLEGRHGDRFRWYSQSVPVLFPALRRYAEAERRPWSWGRMVRNREYVMVLGLAAIVAWLWQRM